jgi:acetyl-CoA carboxylase biotin carboxyl carrier protein
MSRKAESGTGGVTASGMQGIDLKIVKRLLKFMQDAGLTELDIEMEGVKVRLRKGTAAESAPAPMQAVPQMMPYPAATAGYVPAAGSGGAPGTLVAGGGGVPLPTPAAASTPTAGGGGAPVTAPLPAAPAVAAGPVIKSPMVGTFYRAPSPTSPPFVNVGDVIKEGQTLCIIEAMKLMNEVKAEQVGKIAGILVENGQPVEFDQVIFELEPA